MVSSGEIFYLNNVGPLFVEKNRMKVDRARTNFDQDQISELPTLVPERQG